MAKVLAVCISENKGERKQPVESVELRENHVSSVMPMPATGTAR